MIRLLLKLKKSTLKYFFKRIKKFLISGYYSRLPTLGGNNIIVEVDEAKFGKRKYQRGHHVEGVWVVGPVERTEQRKMLLFKVERRGRLTLDSILISNVNSNSIIYSDCWKGYTDLLQHFKYYQTENHKKYFKDPVTQVCTNTIEGNWSILKNLIPRRFRNKNLIETYLVKFMIQRNEAD